MTISSLSNLNTIKTVDGENAVVENGDLVACVNNLKKKEGKDIIVYGAANFVSELIKNNLVDEFNLFVNPTAIGNGFKIFTDRCKLKLVSSTSFANGVVFNQYK